MPRPDTNDLNSPSDGGRARAPDTYTPSLTHTVYSAQREETRHTHAATQGQADRCPETAAKIGPHRQRATGGQRAQRQLDPEQDHTPSQHTDYRDRTTNGTTTTRSTARERQNTATYHSTRRNTTATRKTPRGQNNKRCRWPQRQRSHAHQRTTHTKHHYPCQVKHLTARWNPTPKYPPLPKPLTRPWNHL